MKAPRSHIEIIGSAHGPTAIYVAGRRRPRQYSGVVRPVCQNTRQFVVAAAGTVLATVVLLRHLFHRRYR